MAKHKKQKAKHYQCNNCRHIELNAGCSCSKCDGAMLPYRDYIGIGVPALRDGNVYLK